MYENIPEIIPPLTIVKIVRADDNIPGLKKNMGRVYRIGFYSRQDGLEDIWLVDEKGEYVGTVDREHLLKYYEILELTDITDYYGDNYERLGPMDYTKYMK